MFNPLAISDSLRAALCLLASEDRATLFHPHARQPHQLLTREERSLCDNFSAKYELPKFVAGQIYHMVEPPDFKSATYGRVSYDSRQPQRDDAVLGVTLLEALLRNKQGSEELLPNFLEDMAGLPLADEARATIWSALSSGLSSWRSAFEQQVRMIDVRLAQASFERRWAWSCAIRAAAFNHEGTRDELVLTQIPMKNVFIIPRPQSSAPIELAQERYAWSLGTTILQGDNSRCACALDATGKIHHPALKVWGDDDIPPGTTLERSDRSSTCGCGCGGRGWIRLDSASNAGWLAAAQKAATVWTVERTIWKQHGWGQWSSTHVFDDVLEWYPEAGVYCPSEPTQRLPRRPGCWRPRPKKEDRNSMVRVVELGFALHCERQGIDYHYRADSDPVFGCSWTMKYNGHERAAPPEILHEGALVGVFLAHGDRSDFWNPSLGFVTSYAFLKIGSVISNEAGPGCRCTICRGHKG